MHKKQKTGIGSRTISASESQLISEIFRKLVNSQKEFSPYDLRKAACRAGAQNDSVSKVLPYLIKKAKASKTIREVGKFSRSPIDSQILVHYAGTKGNS